MARVESVQWVDDLDGGAAEETVAFSLEGAGWEIDLTSVNAARLRDELAPFVAAARRHAGGSPGGASPGGVSRGGVPQDRGSSGLSVATRRRNAEIRQWALANGFELSERGRIPNSVVEAYDDRAATPGPAGADDAPEPGRDEAAAPERGATSGPVDLKGLFKEASAV